NETSIPPPSPELLAVHAACARILHLSGVAAVLDEVDRDSRPHPVLSKSIYNMEYNPEAAAELDQALRRLPSVVSVRAPYVASSGHSRLYVWFALDRVYLMIRDLNNLNVDVFSCALE
ncbi:hypothetical protein C8F01DRAFT_978905, partial [Mycena amicta]